MEGTFRCRWCGVRAEDLSDHRCPQKVAALARLARGSSDFLGDPISGVMREGVGFPEAVERLAAPPKLKPDPKPAPEAKKATFDRAAYHRAYMKNYMRDYMRRRRAGGEVVHIPQNGEVTLDVLRVSVGSEVKRGPVLDV